MNTLQQEAVALATNFNVFFLSFKKKGDWANLWQIRKNGAFICRSSIHMNVSYWKQQDGEDVGSRIQLMGIWLGTGKQNVGLGGLLV